MSEAPIHQKLGYDHMVECNEHRRKLILNGYKPGSAELHFAVVAAYERAHRHDPSYRERQADWLSRQPQIGPDLTREEIEYLLEKTKGVNDEVGASAFVKLTRKLKYL